MAIFDIGMKILLILTSVFFLIIFFLCAGWSKPRHPERHIVIGFLMSILYTFWFFLGGVLLLTLVIIFIKYLFPLIKLLPF